MSLPLNEFNSCRLPHRVVWITENQIQQRSIIRRWRQGKGLGVEVITRVLIADKRI